MIIKAALSHAPAAGVLAAQLWPHSTVQELTEELKITIESADNAVFLAVTDGDFTGFAHCSLRRDYVEGTETSPVGYLEGIFVSEAYRRRGIAKALLSACEDWAKEMGCAEFASDCEVANEESILFHGKLGFTEANRIVCFCKKL